MSPPRGRNSLRRRAGYVLLVTLAVLTIAATVLAVAGRRSGQLADRAKQRRRQLQQQWAAISCRDAVLPRADELLRRAERRINQPLASLDVPIRLGDCEIALHLTDEQAKADVNLLGVQNGWDNLEFSLRRLQSDLRRPVAVRHVGKPPEGQTVCSFEQLWNFREVSQIAPQAGADGKCPSDSVTCWGGSVNLLRSDRVVLREMLADLLTDTDLVRLEEIRLGSAYNNMDQIAKALNLPQTKAAALAERGTVTSSCFGLWVTIGRGERVTRWFFVAGEKKIWSFKW